jgi:type I restriction enzyme S subunit
MGLSKLGKHLELSERKNNAGLYGLENVKGISIQKCFIDTKADMGGVSLKPYLLVPPNYFAYVPITSRNGEKITIAHNGTDDTYICSSSYIVFNVSNPDVVCSDYLFMYFNRPEFDRYARFNSWGSAREAFSWNDMCDIEINLPPLAIQRKYADAYMAIRNNENYRLRLGNVAPILIKGSLEEAGA